MIIMSRTTVVISSSQCLKSSEAMLTISLSKQKYKFVNAFSMLKQRWTLNNATWLYLLIVRYKAVNWGSSLYAPCRSKEEFRLSSIQVGITGG